MPANPGEAAEAAARGPAPRLEDSVSVAYGVVSYQTQAYELDYGTLAIANHLWLPPGLELDAGVRVGFAARLSSGYCFEAFGAAALAPRFRTVRDQAGRTASWSPSLGLEIGGTTAQYDPSKLAATSAFLEGPGPGGIYGALAARPLRFRLSSFSGSVLGLTSGTMLAHPGRQLRLHLELLQVGLVL